MATISVNEVDICIDKAATWGTAVDLTTAGRLIHASNWSVTGAFDEFSQNDIGFDNFRTEVERLGFNLDVSMTCDLSYHGQWLMILASIMGTSTASPAETTGGQGDYLHVIDLASNNKGKFMTAAWSVEDDYVLEIPSIKWHTFTIESNANGVGTFSAQGIGDRLVDNASASNTYAEITAETYPTYQACVLGGTNHYMRFDDYSTTTALTNADDKNILNYKLTIARPMQKRFTLRGANSPYSLEPLQLNKTTGEFQFQMSEIDNAQIDGIVDWLAQQKVMSELFFDGAQIGTGVNTSIKIQLPYMEHKGTMPTGYDVPSSNTLMQPTFMFNLLKATTAPSGMSGVTNYARINTIDERITARL